ncbi:hypothetical protein K3N28_12550 [Glycomyces sp. TRM65418]|uniref:hypothetical protein n=1 Tax=Glycomyces sp. TRM65418 TaxID=2867006 RepID=UPI001CE5FDDE|nr:hypothetical protein [Glycomyces sp. TRM65418]MCC3763894.1 hypothetical protein [Glycomyces sp. TRM65418]QZD53597.1 hypothetical protein K3N28_12480 [Glycomyces sp. TRM65418]
MAIPEPLGLTRRTILTGAAALLAAGTAGFTAQRPSHASGGPQIRAAAAGWTGRDGELLVLTAGAATESDYTLRLLEPAEPDAPAELGPPLPLALPADFHPHSMAALGPVLWVTGAVESGPDRARPALLRIADGTAAYADLPVPREIRSGIATAVTPFGATGLAAVIEGSPDPHFAGVTRSHLATSVDAGRTWRERPLAVGLGEGYGTVLAETDHGLFAAVADSTGALAAHVGTPDLQPAATVPGSGRPMAAVATAEHVSVFSDRDGTVAETRFTAAGAPLETDPNCACRGEVRAVPGGRGLWLEIDGDHVRVRGAR